MSQTTIPALCINLNVTCVMQVMLVSRVSIDEHNSVSSPVGKHFRVKHSYVPKDEFYHLKKLLQEQVSQSHLWNELRPSLNVQSDSIRTKVFNHFCYFILACILLFSTTYLSHFRTLHTFAPLFYIYTYVKFLSSLLSAIMTKVRPKRRVL